MVAGLVTSIPSPSRAEVHLGPFPLRGYALCIIVGVVVCVIIADRRFRTYGYAPGVVYDIAIWAVPFGLVGGRLYHVITDNELYFRAGENPWRAFAIWDGGLGVWGAISLGAVGALIGCRQQHVGFAHLGSALGPAIPVAQAIGRWGNWFNQELYGRPTGLPWAVRIDPAHRLPEHILQATYQPTFLYESIWDLGTAAFVLLAERYRWFGRLSHGRAFALYVAVYCVGRGWIEYLRIDAAHRFLGLRLNDYTCIVLFVLSVGYLWRQRGAPPDVAPVAREQPPTEVAAPAEAP